MFPTQEVVSPGTHPTDDGTVGYRYRGVTENPREEKIDGGGGLYHDENFEFLNASGDLGFFGPDEGAGTQFGARGEMNSIVGEASLGDMAEFVTLGSANTTSEDQGGWENFLSVEAHGPRASGEASIGTDGLSLNAGADLVGASVKLGGAEYDWVGGSELSVGAGIGGGAGVGLSWSDDDKDGYNEVGFSVGVEAWEGGNVGFKTELPGYIGGAVANSSIAKTASEMIAAGGQAVGDALFPPDEGLQPTTATPSSVGF